MKFQFSISVLLLYVILFIFTPELFAQDDIFLFPVPVNNKIAYIDKTGDIVIEPVFDDGLNFSNGVAPITADKRWGYISRSGIIIFDKAILRKN